MLQIKKNDEIHSRKCERHSTRHIFRQFPCRVDPYLVYSFNHSLEFNIQLIGTAQWYLKMRENILVKAERHSLKCERHSTRHIIRQFPCRVDPYLVVSNI